METKKIALACFIGGVLCCGIALLLTPTFWWLGIIAGLAGGYISYEFREVLKAIPIALRSARKESWGIWENAIEKERAWFSKPHPFIFTTALLAIPACIWIFKYWLYNGACDSLRMVIFLSAINTLSAILLFGEISFVASALPYLFAYIGSRAGKRCYWQPFGLPGKKEDTETHIQELQAKGYHEEPLTYRNALYWMLLGILVSIKFLAWGLWRSILSFVGRFVWNLFKLIHSEKRLLCAIDGTLGGIVSYIWSSSAPRSLTELIIFVIFGGLIGAGLGIANYEIVSKRILHLPADNVTT